MSVSVEDTFEKTGYTLRVVRKVRRNYLFRSLVSSAGDRVRSGEGKYATLPGVMSRRRESDPKPRRDRKSSVI